MFFIKKNRFVATSITAVIQASSAPASFGAYTQSVVNQFGTITVL